MARAKPKATLTVSVTKTANVHIDIPTTDKYGFLAAQVPSSLLREFLAEVGKHSNSADPEINVNHRKVSWSRTDVLPKGA